MGLSQAQINEKVQILQEHIQGMEIDDYIYMLQTYNYDVQAAIEAFQGEQ